MMNLVEKHPLAPYLPSQARLLLLGSFPPQRQRWSMPFYYPNWQNDMWRIFGYLFYGDKQSLTSTSEKRFRQEAIESLLQTHGIALCDTASEVIRQQGNASDKYLSVVTPVDLSGLLRQIPLCTTIATTGQKAAETLAEITQSRVPATGEFVEVNYQDRHLHIYRMPSSSRAYPKSVEEKSQYYRTLFEALGML